jgi:hypothetical protein
MPATIFSSASEVKSYGSNLSLNDVTKILSVSGNPASGAGTAAPVGSIALDYSNGKTYKKTGSLATEWAELGSGVGGINYIVNPDAESGTTGWSTYADAAGAQPVDGTGGSPSVTWTRSTTTPLRGTGDFNFVKDAVNRQGQGVSYDVTVDNADLARVLTVSFDYEVLSGTYATGDLTVYLIQDPTGTPVVIQPAGFQVVAATAGTKMTQIATFQTDVAQKSYRLCFHVATTSASAYTLALDNIVLGPTQKVYGAPVADWVSYTPTIGSFTGSVTNATATARYRRIGDSIEGEATITFSGASAAFTSPNITLPSGLFGDTSKIPDTDTDRVIGICNCLDAGTTVYGPWVVGYNSITNKILTTYVPFVNATSASTTEPVKGTNIANNFPFTFGANDKIFISWKLPILGWSSNVEVSSSTDTRVVAARSFVNGTNTPGASFGARTTVVYQGISQDTHGAYNASTGVYTIPVSGYYACYASAAFTHTGIVGSSFALGLQHSNTGASGSSFGETILTETSTAAGLQRSLVVSQIRYFDAGSTVNVWAYDSNTTPSINNNAAQGVFSINRLSGPSQIAASETVACEYNTAAGGSIGNGANTFIDFGTKETDSHGSVVGAGSGNNTTYTNTWRFVAPLPGRYQVNSVLNISLPVSTGCDSLSFVTVNGNYIARGSRSSYTTPTTGENRGIVLSQIVKVNAGDAISIVCYQNSGGTRTLETNGNANRISIVRVGN